ncbi:MAG: hypothetical protein P8Z49_12585, partial [Acidobacteriota bacterium]
MKCTRFKQLLWLGIALTAGMGAAAQAGAPAGFPEMPAKAECRPQNQQEKEAGAAILWKSVTLHGHAKIGWVNLKGVVTRRESTRYIVFDAQGVDNIAKHILLGEAGTTFRDISGRTVTPDGRVFKLDPKKDVKNLDVRTPGGKTARSMRAA